MKILLTISYLGTSFSGYQIQPKGRTVQGELNRAAKELFGFDCDITGCSRTDSGVHANKFCATVAKKGANTLQTTVPTEKIPRAFNNFLPEDVAVNGARFVAEDFHPRYSVIFKEYVYLIYDRAERDPFSSKRCWHVSHEFDDKAVEKMNAAAAYLVGKHDFCAFMAAGSKIEDTVRTVKYAEVVRDGGFIKLRIAADGFLYNMVRIITGTLVEVGYGKLAPEKIAEIIEGRDRRAAGRTAPPDGLYLNEVIY